MIRGAGLKGCSGSAPRLCVLAGLSVLLPLQGCRGLSKRPPPLRALAFELLDVRCLGPRGEFEVGYEILLRVRNPNPRGVHLTQWEVRVEAGDLLLGWTVSVSPNMIPPKKSEVVRTYLPVNTLAAPGGLGALKDPGVPLRFEGKVRMAGMDPRTGGRPPEDWKEFRVAFTARPN